MNIESRVNFDLIYTISTWYVKHGVMDWCRSV